MQTQCDNDDALIAQFLGGRFVGRRYLRYHEIESLGVCANRASLRNWMDAGGFPRGIKIPGPYGKTLVWHAVEVARHIAQRVAERDASLDSEASTPEWGCSSDSNDDPFAADRNEYKARCPYPTTET